MTMATRTTIIIAVAGAAVVVTTAILAMSGLAGSSTAPLQASAPVAAPVTTATTVPVLPVTTLPPVVVTTPPTTKVPAANTCSALYAALAKARTTFVKARAAIPAEIAAQQANIDRHGSDQSGAVPQRRCHQGATGSIGPWYHGSLRCERCRF